MQWEVFLRPVLSTLTQNKYVWMYGYNRGKKANLTSKSASKVRWLFPQGFRSHSLSRAQKLLLSLRLSASVCVDEELNTLKGIEGESSEDKPLQQVNMAMHFMGT